MELISLSPADEAENQRGRLSAAQAHWLRREALGYALGSLALMGVVGLMAAGAWLHWQDPAFGGRGQFWLAAAVGGLWLWLLAPMPGKWQRTRQDLQTSEVAWLEGPATCEVRSGFGLFNALKYHVTVANMRFQVSATAFGNFRANDRYRVYFAPASKLMLGANRLASAEPAQAGSVVSDPPAPSQLVNSGLGSDEANPSTIALNSRERDILRLAAAGLSNKEIASQLSYSVNTVKTYMSQVYDKLGVRRRTEAVARARELGVLDNNTE